MKKLWCLALFLFSGMTYAGFGIQAGAFSPTSGLEDNDNSILLGANINFKFAVIGIKAEAFWVDSSGRYADQLGPEFGETDIDMEAILAADLMFYPVGTTFFLQVGVNHISLDASEIDRDVIDNEWGIEGGLGITVLDKLMLQGKVMYTPDAIKEDAGDTLKDLDENLFGYMISLGWQF